MKSLFTTLFSILIFHICQAQYVDFEWATGFGDTCFTQNPNMAFDNSGNIVVSGNFRNSGDFDAGSGVSRLVSNGLKDGYVTKLDSNSKHIWSISFGSKGNDNITDVATDANSNIYITGAFEDTVDFDPGPGKAYRSSTGYTDIFILKLDANGNFIWVKTIGGLYEDIGISIKIDPFGDLILGGDYSDSIDADPGPGVQNLIDLGSSAFLLKLTTGGNFIWAKAFQGFVSTMMESMNVDATGAIYCTGLFYDTTDFDPGLSSFTIAPTFGWRDIFIVKLDKQGNFKWAKNVAFPALYPHSRDVVADKTNGVYITGVYEGTIDFDPGPAIFNLTGSGMTAFILKLDTNGFFEWAKSIGSSYNDEGVSMAINSSNDLITTGFISGPTDLDPGPGIYNSGPLASIHVPFIVKLNDKGNFLWARVFKDGAKQVSDINVDKKDHIFLSGTFDGINDFDPSSATYNLVGNYDDSFVLKLSEGGCSNFSISYDSTSSINCQRNSYIRVSAFNGIPPYSYNWNSSPAVNDSVLQVSQSGFYTITATDSNCSTTSTIFIGGPKTGSGFDLQVNLSSSTFRTGQLANVWLDGFNQRCDSVDGEMWLIHDAQLSFQTSTITPASISNDTIKWNFSDLNYGSQHLNPALTFLTDTTLGVGDTICLNAIILPIKGDADSTNNMKEICLPVINSFDPNDKQVYPQGVCEENYTLHDTPLTYTVRFQNTGNAPALDVYILDTLSQHLDLNSLDVISNSHHMYTEVLPGNVLKFVFNNINLPDSLTNPNGSQGYVIFELSPIAELSNGTEIKNTAQIYFDFNEPIVTNTTLNTMVEVIPNCLTSIVENTGGLINLLIYPNPVNSVLYLSGTPSILEYQVLDITGRNRLTGYRNVKSIDVGSLENGIYFLRMLTTEGSVNKKFIKY